ncbi:hypothetical protein CEQ21_22155 [Niallia circulans]|uniref:Uncharacterized protein n=1 Tax=Niallia circulans TaxID=1397 RepID=A0A553SMB9_NIACI|nr:hypothetical protein [Niallia circulans]TRZ38117.1 hypothetical protein CEQ21_22155 [Niallia circulans]
MADNYINEAYMAAFAQKLFRTVFGIVRQQELAELVAQKALSASLEKSASMLKEDWEKYTLKLAVRTAINCKNSPEEQKEKLLRRFHKYPATLENELDSNHSNENKVVNMAGC